MRRPNINKHGYFQAHDNLDIKYSYYGNSDHKRVMLLFPGRAEYIEKYQHIADFFVKKDFLVFMMDWRGQGGSGRELKDSDKGYVKDYSDYQKDLDYFINNIVLPISNGIEIDAIGHSMGGHNLLRFLIENRNHPLKRVLLASPMLGIETSPFPNTIARILAKAAVKTGFGDSYLPGTGGYTQGEFHKSKLTSNYERFMENINYLDKNRKLALGGPVYTWLYNSFISMDFIENNLDKIDKEVDTKVVYGSEDRVVRVDKIKKAGDYLTRGSHEISGGKHELMMETEDILNEFYEVCNGFFHV